MVNAVISKEEVRKEREEKEEKLEQEKGKEETLSLTHVTLSGLHLTNDCKQTFLRQTGKFG